MKFTKNRSIIALTILLISIFSLNRALLEKNDKKYIRLIPEKRKYFLRNYNNADRILISWYEKRYNFSLNSYSGYEEIFNTQNIFYSWNRIIEEINIISSDDYELRAEKIFNFIKNNLGYSLSLYETNPTILNDPVLFLSAFGTANCSYYSYLFAFLSEYFGMPSQIRGFMGHSVAEIFYDASWHIYDPSSKIGIMYENGSVINYYHLLDMAKNNSLPEFNEEIASVKDNIRYPLSHTNLISSQKDNDIILKFLPYEKKQFFNELGLVSTDGKYLNYLFYNSGDYLSNYRDFIGNFIREISLKNLDLNKTNNRILIDGFFPIVGVYIFVPGDFSILDGNKLFLPRIKMNSYLLSEDFWLDADIKMIPFVDGFFYDLSSGLNNLDSGFTKSIELDNIKNLRELEPKSKILIVSVYAKNNISFQNMENMKELKNSNINLEIKKHAE